MKRILGQSPSDILAAHTRWTETPPARDWSGLSSSALISSITINGTPGDDVIKGTFGHDDLYSGAGGSDLITAGWGVDFVKLEFLDPSDFADGGGRIDQLWVEAGNVSDPMLILNGRMWLSDALVATNFESFVVTSGAGDDVLIGGRYFDLFEGGDGNDLIVLRRGDQERLYGDQAHGGAGNDTLWGGNGADSLYGDAGNDILRSWGADDYLSGGDGDDVLRGMWGKDLFYGGNGSDVITGGRQADTFQYGLESNPGADLITDFEVGPDHLTLYRTTITSIETTDLDGTGPLDSLVHLSNGGTVGLLGVTDVTVNDLL